MPFESKVSEVIAAVARVNRISAARTFA
eukprot:COSAG04_NODE_9954_length_817_cov_1.174095_1_plen_27_part_10